MSELEKYVKGAKDSWDDTELPQGHLNRFELRLNRRETQNRGNGATFWRVAAAIILLVAVGLSLLIPNWNSTQDVQYGSLSLSDVSGELAQVEQYYSSKLEKEYVSLGASAREDTLLAGHFVALADLNKVYTELEHELYSSASHQKVVDAMIENFRLRLELLSEIERIHKSSITLQNQEK